MTIEWGPPPRPRDPGYDIAWAEVMEQLESRPGQWAKVIELSTARKAHDLARNLKGGRYKAVDPTRVEIVARNIAGRGGLWMRVVAPS